MIVAIDKAFILLIAGFLWCLSSYGQRATTAHRYSIDIAVPEKNIFSDLHLGGTNQNGERISVNNYYLSRNGQPIIPITGEFHFSRYPEAYWEEAIKKMKAGGINMVATYVFWIMHEEEEGIFNFQNNRNVRKFVELCADHDMPVIIRIGPFGHGEVRNGALPDWLLAKPLTIRSNDPDYLFYAERWYDQIGEQLKGLFFKDGGPIIATQIENEYQHSAAPWGLTYPGQPFDFTASDRDRAVTQEGVGVSTENNPYLALGNDHMKVLKSLAVKAGFETPLYTVTGWGNAAIIPNESLPVTAAYPYPTWTKKKEPSPFYRYQDIHKNPDYSPVRYDPESYPAFAAELGGGIMSTYDRRPVIPASSVDALINRCLGSGANGIGYYMYHGGSTPRGKHNFLSDEAYGYPKISYDFQAPIGEFGQTKPSFHRLKLIHRFLNTFGDELAPMTTVLPSGYDTISPVNTECLRYAVRHRGDAGFLFLNNFQDHASPQDKENIQIQLTTSQGGISIPETGGFGIKSGENAIFPFNFDMAGAALTYATAQLLTKSDDPENPYFVFFAPEGVRPEFSFKKTNGVEIVNSSGAAIKSNENHWLVNCPEKGASEFIVKNQEASIKVLVVDKDFALTSWTVMIGDKKHLIFSEADVLSGENGIEFLMKGHNTYELFIYPRVSTPPRVDQGAIVEQTSTKVLSHFKVEMTKATISFKSNMVNDKRLVVSLDGSIPENLNDVILRIECVGDTGMGFLEDELVVDEFYKGLPWEIGLRYFSTIREAKAMNFYFRPIYQGAPFLVDLEENNVPDFTEQASFTKIEAVDFIPVYRSVLQFEQ